MPAGCISARRHCASDSAAAFDAEKVPCGGIIGEREDRDSRLTQATAPVTPSAPRAAHHRAEFLRQAQQTEIVHVHLGARHFDARARGDAEGAMIFRGVDEDVDLDADLAGKLAHRDAHR